MATPLRGNCAAPRPLSMHFVVQPVLLAFVYPARALAHLPPSRPGASRVRLQKQSLIICDFVVVRISTSGGSTWVHLVLSCLARRSAKIGLSPAHVLPMSPFVAGTRTSNDDTDGNGTTDLSIHFLGFSTARVPHSCFCSSVWVESHISVAKFAHVVGLTD